MAVPGDCIATAALLERAYRMALLLQGRLAGPGTAPLAAGRGFDDFIVASELLALLDEARAALLPSQRR